MTIKKMLWRVFLGLSSAIIAFRVFGKIIFSEHHLIGIPYLGESIFAFLIGSLAVLGIPLVFQRMWDVVIGGLSEIIDKTVRRAFWDLWSQRSRNLKETKKKRKQEAKKKQQEESRRFASRPILLDTSVLIDGRFLDVVQAGFVDNPLVVMSFVLEELQRIADSSDSLKRQRGRRGFEMLEELKKLGQPHIEVVTAKKKTKDVDKELLSTAKKMHGKVATVDFNLNRVSKVSGVEVLNVNYLANALKTIVLPGERIKVKVIQEGTANKQGVGFLEDGTMVVVEEGRTLVGKQIDVVVTRVLQTEAGRMIFAKNPSKL